MLVACVYIKRLKPHSPPLGRKSFPRKIPFAILVTAPVMFAATFELVCHFISLPRLKKPLCRSLPRAHTISNTIPIQTDTHTHTLTTSNQPIFGKQTQTRAIFDIPRSSRGIPARPLVLIACFRSALSTLSPSVFCFRFPGTVRPLHSPPSRRTCPAAARRTPSSRANHRPNATVRAPVATRTEPP